MDDRRLAAWNKPLSDAVMDRSLQESDSGKIPLCSHSYKERQWHINNPVGLVLGIFGRPLARICSQKQQVLHPRRFHKWEQQWQPTARRMECQRVWSPLQTSQGDNHTTPTHNCTLRGRGTTMRYWSKRQRSDSLLSNAVSSTRNHTMRILRLK